MNVHKMLPVLSLILTLSNCLAAQQQEQPLANILEEGLEPVREKVFPGLSNRDLVNLAQTSKRLHKLVEEPLAERQQEAAIYLSNVLNAKVLNLSNKKTGATSSNDAFRQYVLTQIKDFSIKNQGRWIKLDLTSNNLGGDQAFLNTLIYDIAMQAKTLRIEIEALYLSRNNLTTLPLNIFAGLSNLNELDLGYNQLTSLPNNIFAGLSKLKSLDLSHNQLTSLPENIFAGLSKLKNLWLYHNHLTILPEKIFAGLPKLEILSLNGNQLTGLPKNIFAGLSKLEILSLRGNDDLTPEVNLIISPTVWVHW